MAKNGKPILLDGGMGQEIYNRGGKAGYGEWAVAALYEDPDLVREIHVDYIRAGADVITTNTYGTTRPRMKAVGMEDRFEALLRRAGELASDAREKAGRDGVRIATSLPPLEASYINEFELSYDETRAQFAEMMDLLDPYVDIYLGETLSTSFEVRAFLEAAQGRGKTTWLALTLVDHGGTDLRGGEKLGEVISQAREYAPDALLINCCTPDSVMPRCRFCRSAASPSAGTPMVSSRSRPLGRSAAASCSLRREPTCRPRFMRGKSSAGLRRARRLWAAAARRVPLILSGCVN